MPINKDSLQLGNVYNLTTYSPSVLGTNNSNLLLEAVLSYKSALHFAQNIAYVHAKVGADVTAFNATLEPGEAKVIWNPHAEAQTYCLFVNKFDPNKKVVMAVSWISTANIIASRVINISMTLKTADVVSINRLKALLDTIPSVVESYTITQQ